MVCLPSSHGVGAKVILDVCILVSHFPESGHRRHVTSGDAQELAPIGIGPTIRHAQDACSCVFQAWMYLVLEFLAIYGRPAAASSGWIAGLEHEVRDNAVKYDIVVIIALSESEEVLAGLERA